MRGKVLEVALGVQFSSWGGPLLHFRISLAVSTGGLVCRGHFAQPAPLQAFAVLRLIYDGVVSTGTGPTLQRLTVYWVYEATGQRGPKPGTQDRVLGVRRHTPRKGREEVVRERLISFDHKRVSKDGNGIVGMRETTPRRLRS